MEQFDLHYRILAVVYVNETNLNEQLVNEGYAEVMYISPSEFDPYKEKVNYTPSHTQTPGFELLFAIIGVVAVVFLVRQ